MSLGTRTGPTGRSPGRAVTTSERSAEAVSTSPFRIQLFSDLHGAPLADVVRPAPDVDAVVSAGDLTRDVRSTFEALRDAFPPSVPVVCVLGNEPFHHQVYEDVLRSARSLAPSFDVVLLEDAAVTVGCVRFVGATFCTDFRLHGADPAIIETALDTAEIGIPDFVRIRTETGSTFCPYSSMWRNNWSRVCIGREFLSPFDGPTVVVTHHPPSARGLPSGFETDLLAPAYASSIESVVADGGAAVWMHGHAETSADHVVGRTRVVANPFGAEGRNARFDPASSSSSPCPDPETPGRDLARSVPRGPDPASVLAGDLSGSWAVTTRRTPVRHPHLFGPSSRSASRSPPCRKH